MIDVEVVARAVADAEAALERGEPRAALATATSALEIAARPLLPEFDGAWVHERRRELQEHATALLEAQAAAALRIGGEELAQGERAARELTRREPFRESGYARLMEIHEARGNVAEAVRVFDELRVLLRDELGTAPSAQIVALNARLLRGERRAGDRADGRGAAAAAARRGGRRGAEAALRRARGRAGAPARALGRGARRRAPPGRSSAARPGSARRGCSRTSPESSTAERANVLYGRCDEGALLPYQPFMEALRHFVVHCGPPQLPGQADPELAELARLVPELRSGAGDAAAPPPGEPETQRYRLFEAMTGFPRRRRRAWRRCCSSSTTCSGPTRRPLLFLRHLLRRAVEAPLLVAAAYRDAEVVAAPLGELLTEVRRDARVDRIALAGVERGRHRGRSSPPARRCARPPDFVAQLHARTGGNPLYIRELLRDLAESGGELAELVGPGGCAGGHRAPPGAPQRPDAVRARGSRGDRW